MNKKQIFTLTARPNAFFKRVCGSGLRRSKNS